MIIPCPVCNGTGEYMKHDCMGRELGNAECTACHGSRELKTTFTPAELRELTAWAARQPRADAWSIEELAIVFDTAIGVKEAHHRLLEAGYDRTYWAVAFRLKKHGVTMDDRRGWTLGKNNRGAE